MDSVQMKFQLTIAKNIFENELSSDNVASLVTALYKHLQHKAETIDPVEDVYFLSPLYFSFTELSTAIINELVEQRGDLQNLNYVQLSYVVFKYDETDDRPHLTADLREGAEVGIKELLQDPEFMTDLSHHVIAVDEIPRRRI